MKARPRKSKRALKTTREKKHAQLRKEVEEMRSGVEMAEETKTDETRDRAPPPRRRFVPVMPRDYVTGDQLRADLQEKIAGIQHTPRPDASDLIPKNIWWNT